MYRVALLVGDGRELGRGGQGVAPAEPVGQALQLTAAGVVGLQVALDVVAQARHLPGQVALGGDPEQAGLGGVEVANVCPMVEPVIDAQTRPSRARRPRRPSAACLTASRCSRMAAHQGSPGSAGVVSSSQARSESSSLAWVRTSSRQAVGTGSPIGNSGEDGAATPAAAPR